MTGIRKGLTPEALLNESALTQSRDYIDPVRKEIPAVFARKRAMWTAFDDDEEQPDEVDQLDEEDDDEDQIDSLCQNILAAKRSKKRKLEHLWESSLEKERQEKEQWRERALRLSSILSGLNQSVPDFSANQS